MLPLPLRCRAAGNRIPAKELVNLTAFHFAVGSILGDGWIRKERRFLGVGNKSPSFLLWKRELAVECGLCHNQVTPCSRFKVGPLNATFTVPLSMRRNFVFNGPKNPTTRKATSRLRTIFEFKTNAWFNEEWINTFYTATGTNPKTGKVIYRKSIPQNLKEYFFHDLALTLFFLDDGWVHVDRLKYCLATGQATVAECKILQTCLQDNFNLKTTLQYSNNEPHHLQIEKESEGEFTQRVAPYYLDFVKKFRGHRTSKAQKNKFLFEYKEINGVNTPVLLATGEIYPDKIERFWRTNDYKKNSPIT